MSEVKEIYKQIPDYPDYYVSNYGNVKSYKKNKKGKLLTPIMKYGYKGYNLYRSGKMVHKQAHALVAYVFMGYEYVSHKEGVVNHKDSDKLNNFVDNLEIISSRENTSHWVMYNKNYIGTYIPERDKYAVNIRVYGKKHFIGYYSTKNLSSQAYTFCIENKDNFDNITDLKKFLKKNLKIHQNITKKKRDIVNGCTYQNKLNNKWKTEIKIEKKRFSLGTYETLEEANEIIEIGKRNAEKYINNEQYRELCKKIALEKKKSIKNLLF